MAVWARAISGWRATAIALACATCRRTVLNSTSCGVVGSTSCPNPSAAIVIGDRDRACTQIAEPLSP